MCLFTGEEHAAINKYSQFRLKIELIVGTKPTLKIHIHICTGYNIDTGMETYNNGPKQRSFNNKLRLKNI